MVSRDTPLLLYGWRPSWIVPKKRVKRVEKFEPYDYRAIWSPMMQYPPLTQFGQTNLANSNFVTSQPPLDGDIHDRTCKIRISATSAQRMSYRLFELNCMSKISVQILYVMDFSDNSGISYIWSCHRQSTSLWYYRIWVNTIESGCW